MSRKLMIGMTGLFLLLALLVSCRGKGSTPGAANGNNTPVAQPEDQKGTVTGNVISTTTNKPYPKVPVWLAEVFRQDGNGAYVLNLASSPAVYADDNGAFVIANVDPKDYVIVVGDPEGQYVVIPDDSGKARVWNVEAGKILDVGTLDVSLSPLTP